MRFLTSLLLLALVFAPNTAQDAQTFTDDLGVRYTVERYMTANYPVALAFAPDGRLFYTEKNTGSVRVVSVEGERQAEPVINLPTSGLAERGMLGIAFDPAYDENGHIWIAHIREATTRDLAAFQVVRFVEDDGIGSDPEVMLSIPLENNALIHHGGNLRFDDEGRLYISVGDQEDAANSQDIATPQGSILRFEVGEDGLIPAGMEDDNPVFAYGFRNPYDFDIDPLTDNLVRIFATENGENCDDEINMVLRGFNYGAGPDYECGGTAAGIDLSFYQPPLLSYTPTEAPTGLAVYGHEAVPEWVGSVFFCTWNSSVLRRVTLNEGRNAVEETADLALGEGVCRIDVAVGPEGGLYMASVGEDGGEIWRVLPG